MTSSARTEAAVSSSRRSALCMAQPCGCDEDGLARVAAPDAPIVTASDDEELVVNSVLSERLEERPVLEPERVHDPGVGPDERVPAPQLLRYLLQELRRTVVSHAPRICAEDARDVLRQLVARPALDHAELAGVVEGDVDRAVSARGQTADRTGVPGADRPVATVDRLD